MTQIDTSEEYARALDAADPLAPFRQRFVIDDPSLIYLDGNSLGRLPQATLALSDDIVRRQWGGRLIRSWNEGWMDLSGRIGSKIADVIGAKTNEVVMADSTSVNLFKLALAVLRSSGDRNEIVTDALNFPSDRYILESVARLGQSGSMVRVAPSDDGLTVAEDAIDRLITERTALVALTHTAFKSGFTYDLAAITALAHRKGARILWDVSHSVGALPVDVGNAQADLAVGCGYKYLNGGPGAPAFLFVREDSQKALDNPLSGWFSHRQQFAFAPDYEPAEDINRFLTGTPPVVSLALMEPGIDLHLEAGMGAIRAKSICQSEYFISLWENILVPQGFTLNSPRNPDLRGSHVSLGHPEAYRIDQSLIHDRGIIPDFRTPDLLRFGITPLYTRYGELRSAIMALREIVRDRLYERFPVQPTGVT